MDASKYSNTPLVDSILHPTDFTESSLNAFAHALAAAMNARTELVLLHAGEASAPNREWTRMPGVRETLERWGYLENGSPRAAVFAKLAMKVGKVYLKTGNAYGGIMDYLARNPVDLIVLATEGRDGLPAWIRPSLAEKVALHARTMTLFVPSQAKGFVSLDDGQVRLQRILVPFDKLPDPAPAITYAVRAAVFSGAERIEMHLLHAGEPGSIARPDLIERPYLDWRMHYQPGNPVDSILSAAAELDADMIVMATQNRDGFLDAFRSSVTQKVVRGAPCPVLAVPLDM